MYFGIWIKWKANFATSAGKISILGTTEVNGQKAFALKFNEGRNMAWMDKVYLAKFDPQQTKIDKLAPFDTERFFYEDELAAIENELARMNQKHRPLESRNARRAPRAKAAR